MEIAPDRRPWDVNYYGKIIKLFAENGYIGITFSEYHEMRLAVRNKILLIRQHVEDCPDQIVALLAVQSRHDFKATYLFHVYRRCGCLFDDVYSTFQELIGSGNEIRAHSNSIEFSMYFCENTVDIIWRERLMLEPFVGLTIPGHACHPDLNYIYSSLPIVNNLGPKALGFDWSAYDAEFHSENIIYVNEGLAPHLVWSRISPEEAAPSGQNVCLMIHPRWRH